MRERDKSMCDCGKIKDKRSKQCQECVTLIKASINKGETKFCNGCKKDLAIIHFSPRMKRNKLTLRSRCDTCDAKDASKWRVNNPLKVKQNKNNSRINNPIAHRNISLRKTWKAKGYDPWAIHEFRENHSGKCDICGKTAEETGKKVLGVDHNHETGRVRGLLCNGCNTGIGLLKDSVELLEKAINYLKSEKIQIYPKIPAQISP